MLKRIRMDREDDVDALLAMLGRDDAHYFEFNDQGEVDFRSLQPAAEVSAPAAPVEPIRSAPAKRPQTLGLSMRALSDAATVLSMQRDAKRSAQGGSSQPAMTPNVLLRVPMFAIVAALENPHSNNVHELGIDRAEAA